MTSNTHFKFLIIIFVMLSYYVYRLSSGGSGLLANGTGQLYRGVCYLVLGLCLAGGRGGVPHSFVFCDEECVLERAAFR